MQGRYVRLELDDDGTWLQVLGEQSSSMAISRSPIDASAADSSFRRRIAGGVAELELRAAGIVRRGPGLSKLKQAAYIGAQITARLVDEDGLVVRAECLAGKFERSAAQDGAERWAITLSAYLAPSFAAEEEIAEDGLVWVLHQSAIASGDDVIRARPRAIHPYTIGA